MKISLDLCDLSLSKTFLIQILNSINLINNSGTKHAVRAVTESMRQELNKLKDTKIRVCVSTSKNQVNCL